MSRWDSLDCGKRALYVLDQRPQRRRTPQCNPCPSSLYQLCLLAKGDWDAAVSVSMLHEWDIAAAGLILSEAGGTVTDQQGRALQYNAEEPFIDGMICAAPELHTAIHAHLIPK